jgi:hypothetical protein
MSRRDKISCFSAVDDDRHPTLRKRIPDMTFGLASYGKDKLRYKEESCGDGSQNDLHCTLIRERLQRQMFHKPCGLLVDPRWGHCRLLFPWAVYEAKKTAATWEKAEAQLYETASVYLGMLDDLCRDPNDPSQYQDGAPERHQIFGITSSAQFVRVYRVLSWFGRCVSQKRC